MLNIYLPITSHFFKKNTKNKTSNLFHFNLHINKKFSYICLENFKDNPSLEYKHDWLTCFEPENHLDQLCEYLINNFLLEKKNIFGFSFKDDSLIQRIKNNYKKTTNIKTSKELGLPVKGACLYKLFKFCNYKNIKKIGEKNGKADILLVRHILEHTSNIEVFLESLKLFLNTDGIIIFEVPDSERGFKRGMQTLLWEEHASYFTKDSLFNVLRLFGFEIKEFFRHKNKIEDILVVIAKIDLKRPNYKNSSNYKNSKLLKQYEANFNLNKEKINKRINKIISSGSEIYLFGAGHHASSFVSINQLNKEISYILDDNPEKHNYLLPGSSIPIMPSSTLKNKKNKIHIFLTTNPEKNQDIKNMILTLNSSITIESIFDFY